MTFFSERNLKIVMVAQKEFIHEMFVDYDKKKKEVLNSGAARKERENEIWNEYFTDLKIVGLVALDDMIDLRVSITIDEL